MTELPEGWCQSTLGEATASTRPICYGVLKPGPYVASGVPMLRIVDIVGYKVDTSLVHRISSELDKEFERSRLKGGELLLSIQGTVGRAALCPESLAGANISRTLAVIEPDRRFQKGFLRFYFWHLALERGYDAGGTTRASLNISTLREMLLPLPPTFEQARIVAAIDEAFSKLDAGETGLRTVRQLLKRMREAVLAAAVTGRLVPQDPADTPATKVLADLGVERLADDDRGELPTSWEWVRLGDVCRVRVGATPSRSEPALWGGAVAWVSSGEVSFNRIRSTRETIAADALAGRPDRILPVGTVMLAMIGEGRTRGQPAILDIPAAHNQNCASIQMSASPFTSEWLFTFLSSRYEQTRRAGSGNNQPALNKRLVESIEVPLAPPQEQIRIVTEVDRQLSFIASCEQALDVGLNRSGALRRTILNAAFEGRLVPQDPSDDPASTLLEQIRAERAAGDESDGGRRRKKVEAS